MEIEKGKPVHCAELSSGKTGTLLISEGEIRAELFSFDEPFFIKADAPVYFRSETGHIVSFHANIEGNSGTRSNAGVHVVQEGIVSNVAVVGPDQWTEIDAVKVASFRVDHTTQLLRNREGFKKLGKRIPDDLTIFSHKVDGVTVKAWYGGIWGSDFDAPKDFWPTYEIEFDEPKSILDYVGKVSDYVDFLSFCLGAKLRPTHIQVRRLSDVELEAAIDAGTYSSSHDVHYVWPETEIDSRDLWVGGSPVHIRSDEELEAFKACLARWMDRAAVWKSANVLMMTSLGLKHVVSAERLITACRWLEEIPIARSREALSSDEVAQIAQAALAKAEELGHSSAIKDRIAGAVSRVKSESGDERFTRLVALVEDKFGKGTLPEQAVQHLKQAMKFRGKVAHGHFHPESDEDYRAFNKSTHAVEALCHLLMAVDLPVPRDGLSRMASNPVIRDYHQAYD